MTVIERKSGVGCDTPIMGGKHCGRPGEGLCSRCWAVQHDEDAATLRQQLRGSVKALEQARDTFELLRAGEANVTRTARAAIAEIDAALRAAGGQ